jgi:predicted nucleic acid-binding Zn ribbon protein
MNESFETMQKICPQCGEAVDTDARFCKYCAFDLANSNVSQNISTEINQTPTKNNTLIISGVIGLLVVGFVGLVIFFNTGKNSQSVVENANSVSQASASTLTLGEKAEQIEQKILRGESLSATNLEGLSTSELRILRNVHFARYGRKYEKPGLGDYFSSRPWYKPNDSFNDKMLTSIDKANVALILSLEQPSNLQTDTTTTAVANNSAVTPPERATINSPKELSRETVFNLVSNRRTDIEVSTENSSILPSTPRTDLFRRMIEAKVVSCSMDKGIYFECKPGPKGSILRAGTGLNSERLYLLIGYKSPSEVSGISKSNENSAFADAGLSYKK